jgi:multisubunit Na+/H+ antiporter MnhB subunit
MTSGLPWGLALSSGVNTYLPLFLMALFARFGHVVHVSGRFAWLVTDQAIVVLGVLAACEILAQKFPFLDNFWDFIHTLLRPLAGALAAGATLNTNNAFEIVVAMLLGGSLAAAAHSTKSSLRLVSTSKSFGMGNLFLSLGEDAAVVTATLLSVYAPWVMLGIVVLFIALFALLGPRLLRMLSFDLQVLGSGLKGLARWCLRLATPQTLKESLLEHSPERLRTLTAHLEPGEELYGVLSGWKRARGGPRRTLLLLTSRRLLWLERRFLRRPKLEAAEYRDVNVARYRNLILYSKLEVVTRRNENLTLSLAKTQSRFGQWAVQKICGLAALEPEGKRLSTPFVAASAALPR